MRTPLTRLGLALILAAGLGASVQERPGPRLPPASRRWIVNQTICLPPYGSAGQPTMCEPQSVPVGGLIEVQLPGTPSTWQVLSNSPNLVPAGSPYRLANPGRLTGTSELYVFDFNVVGPGDARIAVQESPAFVAPEPSGTFIYSFAVQGTTWFGGPTEPGAPIPK